MNQISTQVVPAQKELLDNFEKGYAFESYITTLFNQHNFHRKKWRESRNPSDIGSLVDHSYPDLEIELVFTGIKKYRFAIECKWRAAFYNGKIKWARNDSQICTYQMFQDRVRIPVFVAIGIGGEPSMPEKLFVTPLVNICMNTYVSESDLIPFKRKPTHKFYYDPDQLKLF